MAISYKKLWKLLIDKDMKKKDLAEQAKISSYTINKLNKGDNVMSEAGFPAIGIPDCYEEPEVTLDDEWINIKTTFKKPTRDYWFTNGVIEVKNFRIRYDGTEKQDLN